MIKQWCMHVCGNGSDAFYFAKQTIKAILAPIFGKRTHRNVIEWRGTMYRYDARDDV